MRAPIPPLFRTGLLALALATASASARADDVKKPQATMEVLDDEPIVKPAPKPAGKPAPPPAAAVVRPPPAAAVVKPPPATAPRAPAPAETAEKSPTPEAHADAKAAGPSGAGGDVAAKPAAGMVVEDGPGPNEEKPPVPVGEEKQAIAEYIRDQTPDIHRCYQRRLDERPTLQGKLYVILYIGPDGRVMGTTTSGMQDAEMVRCILPLVRKWEFNKPQSGGKLMVKYPFVFRPQAARQ